MIPIRINRLIFLIFIFLSYCPLFAQSFSDILPSRDWTKELAEIIQDPTRTVENRTRNLEMLRADYRRSVGKRDTIFANITHRLAIAYADDLKYERAILLNAEAIAIKKKEVGRRPKLAEYYFRQGTYYQFLEENRKALSYLDSAARAAFEGKNELILAKVNVERAILNSVLEKYSKSLELSENVLAMGTALPSGMLAEALSAKTEALLFLKEIDDAQKQIPALLNFAKDFRIEAKTRGKLYITLAKVSLETGNSELAVNYFQTAISTTINQRDFVTSAMTYIQLAETFERLDEMGKAEEMFLQANLIAERSQKKEVQVSALLETGQFYFRRGDFESALKQYQQGIIHLISGFEEFNWELNPAVYQLRRSINEKSLFFLLSHKARSLLGRANKVDDAVALGLALETVKLADRMIDHMRWVQIEGLSGHSWERMTAPLYSLGIEVARQRENLDDVFYFFEKSRAVFLNDKISELGKLEYIERGDLEKERKYKRDLIEMERKLASLNEGESEYRNVSRAYSESWRGYEGFIRVLEEKYPLYYQYKFDTGVLRLDDFKRAYLNEDQTFVSFFFGEEEVYIFKTERDQSSLKKVEIDKIVPVYQKLLESVNTKPSSQEEEAALVSFSHEFYQLVFAPLEIQTKRIMISPGTEILPFEVLIEDPNDAKSLLVKKHAFSYTYSASFLSRVSKVNFMEEHGILSFAPVEFEDNCGLRTLEGSDQSLKKLEKYYPKTSTYTFTKATKRTFVNNISDYSLVHIYAHHTLGEADDELSIFFADEPILISELQKMPKVYTQLLVLTGGGSTGNNQKRGKAAFSLARALASSSIPSSIVDLWDVNEDYSVEVLEEFYKYLSQGYTTDEALQQAKISFLNKFQAEKAHPFYWAGPVLIGKSNTFNPAEYWFTWPNLIIALVIFFILYILIDRRKIKWPS
ncbi:CHAT domain-containing protein [Indibacter alkaliphilus]|uniref:CHAT domain-containing protein n=1 Tax=Indibacter alkaliphilus TaxID=579922 RepID=UPI000282256C|nr:CHAT domain-containing protein [Indibacter alkaliphilus]